jgi:hypothetical protein
MIMMNRTVVGLAGAGALALGVFVPVVSMPVVGSINYFRNGEGDGVVILALVLISLLLIARRWFRGLIVTGTLSLALLLMGFLRLRNGLAEIRTSMETELADNPFRGLGEAMLGSVQIQWGWAVLVFGSLLLIASGLMRPTPVEVDGVPEERDEVECPSCAEKVLRRASICRHCGRELKSEQLRNDASPENDDRTREEQETRRLLSGE